MSEYKSDNRPRRPLREVVIDIDRDILRLLLRRHNLLERMRSGKGHLEPGEEKILRQAWEAAASRVSHDPRLSGRFFSLMQEVEFMPRPAAPSAEGQEADAAEAMRTAFNLAPPHKAVHFAAPAPQSCRLSRAWLMLAAAAGQPLRLEPCLLNDAIVDCVKALAQMGSALTREAQGVTVRAARPVERPDKVLHVGDSSWNFFLLLGYYLGGPSRAKFTGGSSLRLADFSAVRRFLPQMGARLTHVVPRSDGLPVRLESSGILPGSISIPADVPAELAEGILLSAPFYEKSLRIDLSAHPQRQDIMDRVLPLLQAVRADVTEKDFCVHVIPGSVSVPEKPSLPMDASLAAPLLALPLLLAGEVRLEGGWSQNRNDDQPLAMLRSLGLKMSMSADHVTAAIASPLAADTFVLPTPLAPEWLPFGLALAAAVCLRSGEARIPSETIADADMGQIDGFLLACGLERDENGLLHKASQSANNVWNAPSPAWALALALAACARDARSTGFKLGNPGIMMGLYPAFWALYNSLPEPALKRPQPDQAPAPVRRRIRTNAIAVPPEMPDEEY